MKFVLGVLLLLSTASAWADDAALLGALEKCRTVVQPDRRLSCYDDLDPLAILSNSQPRFAGKLSVETDVFEIDGPTVLRFQSDGAIFVLALHNEAGEIVQNLHIGGGGEDQYLIEKPGRYFLRVNGSTTWRIWLESA